MSNKKRKLFDYFADRHKIYDGPCVKATKRKVFKPCAPLGAVLDVGDESKKRPALELAPAFNLTTGKMVSPKLVYFVRQNEFAELVYCPFCGVKVASP